MNARISITRKANRWSYLLYCQPDRHPMILERGAGGFAEKMDAHAAAFKALEDMRPLWLNRSTSQG